MCLQLECCGAVGPQDYFHSVWYNHTEHTMGPLVPASCCAVLNQAEHADTDPTDRKDCQVAAANRHVFGPIFEEGFKQTIKVSTRLLMKFEICLKEKKRNESAEN